VNNQFFGFFLANVTNIHVNNSVFSMNRSVGLVFENNRTDNHVDNNQTVGNGRVGITLDQPGSPATMSMATPPLATAYVTWRTTTRTATTTSGTATPSTPATTRPGSITPAEGDHLARKRRGSLNLPLRLPREGPNRGNRGSD